MLEPRSAGAETCRPPITSLAPVMSARLLLIDDDARLTGMVGDYLRAIPPLTNGVGGRFLAVNRDKRSLALDLKHPAGRDAFLRMVERADVVVESFRPGSWTGSEPAGPWPWTPGSRSRMASACSGPRRAG